MVSFLETAMDIAREAGALVSNMAERRIPFELKGDFDLVTAADRASEELIVERLQSHFPTHTILGEEGGQRDRQGEYCWYVDPIDGTTNFAHGFPAYNITMAVERAGELVAGVIFDPTRNEMFAAEKGGGAYLNGRRIHVSRAAVVADSLVATGFPSRKRHENVNIHFYYQLAMISHGVRRAGAAALDLAYVASGRLDGFWEFGLNPWDMAAGILLVEEAGGRCADMHGEPRHLRGKHILVDNGLIHQEMLQIFSEVFAGKFRYPLPEIQVSV
ncbi:MAG: inositol monophosphatase family protein [Bryobacteraceae bacterium]